MSALLNILLSYICKQIMKSVIKTTTNIQRCLCCIWRWHSANHVPFCFNIIQAKQTSTWSWDFSQEIIDAQANKAKTGAGSLVVVAAVDVTGSLGSCFVNCCCCCCSRYSCEWRLRDSDGGGNIWTIALTLTSCQFWQSDFHFIVLCFFAQIVRNKGYPKAIPYHTLPLSPTCIALLCSVMYRTCYPINNWKNLHDGKIQQSKIFRSSN